MIRKLYIDLSVLGPGAGGVAIYAKELAHQMANRFDCTVVGPEHVTRAFAQSITCPDPLIVRNSFAGRRPGWKWESGLRYGKDTFVYAPHMRGNLNSPHQAITIHDLIAHEYPTRNFLENAYNKYVLHRVARGAELVLTVSESSRLAIAEYYDVPKEKIAIVPNGIDLSRWKPDPHHEREGRKYLLVVSANRPYKNTLEIIQNHQLWSSQYDLKIVHSMARYGVTLRNTVEELGLREKVEFLDQLSEDKLISLYQGAAAVLYPSLIEGFGRPALEAMAVGRPVILSDIPPHVEIFSDAGIFITPGVFETWERAFRVLDDTHDVAQRTLRGLAIAAKYSWETCGDRLASALTVGVPDLEALRLRA